MDLLTFCEKLYDQQCPRWDDRRRRLHALDLIRRGAHYENLPGLKDFEDSRGKSAFGDTNKYVPVKDRRPGVEYDLPGIIVRDTVSMLFSDAKFPTVIYEDESDTDAAKEIIAKAKLREIMPKAAERGSIGVAIIVPEVFEGDPGDDGATLWLDTWNAYECEPIFKRNKPWILDALVRTWEVRREALIADAYDIDELEKYWNAYEIRKGTVTPESIWQMPGQRKRYAFWYLRRKLDENDGLWYYPVPKHIYERKDWDEWEQDDDRSTHHGFGFCPAIYVFNLGVENWPDGVCTFKGAITNSFMIDRVFSVGGQAIISAGMPQMAIAGAASANTYGAEEHGNTAGLGGGKTMSPDEIIEVEEKGGAWLVQMSAEAVTAMDTWVKVVRMISIENCGGSRISEETATGAKSGYALELINQPLILVTDLQRLAYGEPCLVRLIEMIDAINKVEPLAGFDGAKLSDKPKLKELNWPPYYEPTGQDLQFAVGATTAARDAGFITDETGAAQVAPLFDVHDPVAEQKNASKQAADRAQADVDAQVQVIKAKPAPGGPA